MTLNAQERRSCYDARHESVDRSALRLNAANRPDWLVRQDGLTRPITLSAELPPLRMLLIWSTLPGHSTVEPVLWLFRHGSMPLFTPLGGSSPNMTESVQRILKRWAPEGHYPPTADDIIAYAVATAEGWNRQPTPLV